MKGWPSGRARAWNSKTFQHARDVRSARKDRRIPRRFRPYHYWGWGRLISGNLPFDRFANEAKRTATFISVLVHLDERKWAIRHGIAVNLRIYYSQLLVIFSRLVKDPSQTNFPSSFYMLWTVSNFWKFISTQISIFHSRCKKSTIPQTHIQKIKLKDYSRRFIIPRDVCMLLADSKNERWNEQFRMNEWSKIVV